MKKLKRQILGFSLVAASVACSSPITTQTGNNGNNTSNNIAGSTGSSIGNSVSESKNNAGSGPSLNLGCLPSGVNVGSPNSPLNVGNTNCTNAQSAGGGSGSSPQPLPSGTGLPVPTPTPSGTGLPVPTPTPSGLPVPTPIPSGTPMPTPSPSITPDPQIGIAGPNPNETGDFEFLTDAANRYSYAIVGQNAMPVTIGRYSHVVDFNTGISYIGLKGNIMLFNDGALAIPPMADFRNGISLAGSALGIQNLNIGIQTKGSSGPFGLQDRLLDGNAIQFSGLSGSEIIYNNSFITNIGGLNGANNTLIAYADTFNNAIRLVDPDGGNAIQPPLPALNLAASATLISNTNGANFQKVTDVALDPTDKRLLYIVDQGANSIYLFNFETRKLTLFAGNVGSTGINYSQEGALARLSPSNPATVNPAVKFDRPTAIDVAPNGDVYIAERGTIRKISKSTDIVTIFAGKRSLTGNPLNPEVAITATNSATITDGNCEQTGMGASSFSDYISDLKIDAGSNIFLAENGEFVWMRRLSNNCSDVTTLQNIGNNKMRFGVNSALGGTVMSIGVTPDSPPITPGGIELSIDRNGNIRYFHVESYSVTAYADGNFGRPARLKYH